MRVISLILVIIIYVQSFMTAIDRSDYWWLRGWIWVDSILCWIILFLTVGYYSPYIYWFTWETWLTTWHLPITIMFMLLNLLGKYYYTVTTPACLLVTYIPVIPVSCYLTCYTPVIPVPWLSHVDIVTVTTTESSQRFK